MKTYDEAEIKSIAARRWGIQLRRTGSEFHGPCPTCRSGKDRFIIWPEGNTYCRQCGSRGWLEDDKRDWKPDEEFVNQLRARREEEENQSAARLRAWQNGYRAGYLEGYQAAMKQEQREYWFSEGIPDWAISYYQLGYCQEKTFEAEEGEKFKRPAHVIPIKDSSHKILVNIQYRIVEPPDGVGKYRQEAGLSPANFYSRPNLQEGHAIVLEGAKKSIVVLEGIGKAIQVIGWPSMNPHERNIKALDCYSLVYLVLDPGFHNTNVIERAARILERKLRVVEMPVKPDEAFNLHQMDANRFKSYLAQGRRV